MDYAKLDHEKILSYIEAKGGESPVKDTREYSTAHELRVYHLLQQMEMNGEIEVTERALLGAPIAVRKIGK